MAKLLGKKGVRDFCLGLVLLAFMVGLIGFPKECMAAVKDGLSLCLNVIIPSLFPFFVLSALLVDLGLAAYLGRALEGVMRPLFRVGGACASAVVLGFIGGYPVGAKTAIALYENKMCTRTETERLLAFCNNSGPAFILGVVGAGIFGSSKVGFLLYLAHIAASICVGILFRFYKGEKGSAQRQARGQTSIAAKRFTVAFTDSIRNSFFSTLNICAFVLFFTVIIKLLVLSGILPALAHLLGVLFLPFGFSAEWGERLLTGVLEISSGVWTLSGSGTLTGRVTMAAFMLGWAGISVHCQVLSFIGSSGLSTRTYMVGKLLHGGLSALIMTGIGWLVPLQEPVSAYLAEQVNGVASMDFSTALTGATIAAWVIFLFFLVASVLSALYHRQKRRKGRSI